MVHGKFMRSLLCALCLLVCVAAAAEQPADNNSQDRFLRLVRDEDGSPVALELAIVRYAPLDCGQPGPTVDLVAAVHMAEKSYYEQLNRRFEKYDAVLYESVSAEGKKAEKGTIVVANPLTMLQKGITTILDLEFQLDGIDYGRDNMVHADMSPEEFFKSMRTRKESIWGMYGRMMKHAIKQQGKNPRAPTDADLLIAMFDKNRAVKLKRIVAEQFQNLEGMMGALEGPNGSTLISQRNKVALEVLRKQIAEGRQKIAIFYGAGHMADMEQRLREDFSFGPVSTRWLLAWDLKIKPKRISNIEQGKSKDE